MLVGAGPGDPELLTVRAWRALRAADVVLHDALVSDEILELAAGARLVNVGKIGGGPRVEQNEIHELLYAFARAGHDVVRLKGGDPYVFGRGGEEALYLAERGISVEVVPGISSAIAAPTYAGIPVTQRGVATHFTVITGHPMEGGEQELEASWARAAKLGGTLVILMGLGRIGRIMQILRDNGTPEHTPVAVIQDGTRASQRVVVGNAANIAERAKNAKLRAPAMIVVGNVVNLHQTLAQDHARESAAQAPLEHAAS